MGGSTGSPEDLDRLRRALDAVLPPKAETNLPVATWNIRALSHLKAKWAAGPKDSPKWDWHAVACLAEVISRFNVVAVQEARSRPKALKHLLATARHRVARRCLRPFGYPAGLRVTRSGRSCRLPACPRVRSAAHRAWRVADFAFKCSHGPFLP